MSAVGTPPEPTSDEPIDLDGYKLLERIGEGGRGDVWLAQQADPVVSQRPA